MTVDLATAFREVWKDPSKPDSLNISEHPDLAFVYVLPKYPTVKGADELIDWAQDHIQDWMRHFRLHFRPSKGSAFPSVRQKAHQKDQDGKSLSRNNEDQESIEDLEDQLFWRNLQPHSVDAFEFCFTQIGSVGKYEQLACLLPPILQLAEDHEISPRTAGCRCLRRLLELNPKLVVQMGLGELILQILTTNMSFQEYPGLLKESLKCLESLMSFCCGQIGWKPKPYNGEYLRILDGFLEVVLNDLALVKVSSESFPVLLEMAGKLIEMEALASVRYLPIMIPTLLEISHVYRSDPFKQLFKAVKGACAPRLHRYEPILQQIEKNIS